MAKFPVPHDQFFKQVFSKKANAIAFLAGTLPQELKKNLALSKIRHENTSYISDELAETFSDIVYSCPLKGKSIRIVLLFEHKSYQEAFIHIQLLKYMLGIWGQNIKQKEPLQIVVPILIYHGRRAWKQRSFPSYFGDIPDFLGAFIPDFNYLLADLTSYSDDDLKQRFLNHVPMAIAAGLMKHIFNNKELESRLKGLFSENSKYFSKSEGIRFLKTLVLYILKSTEVQEKAILEALDDLPGKVKEEIMTTAEKIEKRGLEKGLEKGMEKGLEKAKLEGTTKMLKEGFDWAIITKITGITRQKYTALKRRRSR